MSGSFSRYVYALSDPNFPEKYRYIGQTANPDKRLTQHMRAAFHHSGMKNIWIRVMAIEARLSPKMTVLKTITGDDFGDVKRTALDIETEMCRQIDKTRHPILNAPYWKERCVASGVDRRVVDAFETAAFGATVIATTDEGERLQRCLSSTARSLCAAFPVLNIFEDLRSTLVAEVSF